MQINFTLDAKIILQRVKKFTNIEKEGDLAQFLGIRQSTISSWKKRNTIDFSLLIKKCEGINYHWLITGDGEMLEKTSNVIKEPNVNYIVEKSELSVQLKALWDILKKMGIENVNEISEITNQLSEVASLKAQIELLKQIINSSIHPLTQPEAT